MSCDDEVTSAHSNVATDLSSSAWNTCEQNEVFNSLGENCHLNSYSTNTINMTTKVKVEMKIKYLIMV